MELCRPLLIKHVGALRDPFLGASVCFQFKFKYEQFPGGPVVKTLLFQGRECGFDPWLQNKVLRATTKVQGSQKKKLKYKSLHSCSHAPGRGEMGSLRRAPDPNHVSFKFDCVLPRGSSFQHHVELGTDCLPHSPPRPVPVSPMFSLLMNQTQALSTPL